MSVLGSRNDTIVMKSGKQTVAIPTFDWRDYSNDWSHFSFHVIGELQAYQAAYNWRHLGHGVRLENNGMHDIWTIIIRKDGQDA